MAIIPISLQNRKCLRPLLDSAQCLYYTTQLLLASSYFLLLLETAKAQRPTQLATHLCYATTQKCRPPMHVPLYVHDCALDPRLHVLIPTWYSYSLQPMYMYRYRQSSLQPIAYRTIEVHTYLLHIFLASLYSIFFACLSCCDMAV